MNYCTAMIKTGITILLTLALTTTLTWAAPDGNKLVKPSLVVDSAGVTGKRIRVGITFEVEPGYHVYWKNPGESGQPPEVKWKLPPGYTASDLQWPPPMKFMVPGAIFNYGYEEKVTLLTTLTPPTGASDGKPEIAADVSWMVCNDDACVPGQGTVTLAWPDESQAEENAKALELVSNSIPVPVDLSEDVLKASPTDGKEKQLKIEWKQVVSKIEFFPADDSVQIQQSSVSTNKMATPPVSTIELFIKPLAGGSAPATVAGVLAYTTADGQRRGIEINVPANQESP